MPFILIISSMQKQPLMKKIYALTLPMLLAANIIFGQTQVTFYTTYGTFQAEMYDSLMPITVGNFLSLVNSEFYDSIIFHRVIVNFVVQGGDPLGTGFGGPGYTIPDEFDSTNTLSNIKQTISMANAGPNTGGSQFFINLKNNTFLDYNKPPLTSAHPIFAIVRGGWNVVDSIGKTPVDGNDRPITEARMDSVRVTGSYLGSEEIARNAFRTAFYPNPVSPESILDVYSENDERVRIEVYSVTGQLVSSMQQHLEKGKNRIPGHELGLLALPSGSYLIHIQSASGTTTVRIVKP